MQAETADCYYMEDASVPEVGEVRTGGPDDRNEFFDLEQSGPAYQDLELAIESVDLGLLSEGQVEDLESGDPQRVEKAILAARREGAGSVVDEGRLPGRISLKAIPTADEKLCLIEATQILRDGRAGSLREALDMASRREAVPEEAESVSAAKTGADVEDRKETDFSSSLATRIEELERQRRQCRDDYDFEQADQLLSQIVEARAEMRDARREQQQVSVKVADFIAAEDSSRERAMRHYADYLDAPDSEFNDWLDVEIALAEKRNDPILNSPDWPEKIADRTFERRMLRKGGGQADSGYDRGLHSGRLTGRAGVRMPGSPVGGGANSMALTASAALSEFENLSPEEQKDVLDRLDRSRL